MKTISNSLNSWVVEYPAEELIQGFEGATAEETVESSYVIGHALSAKIRTLKTKPPKSNAINDGKMEFRYHDGTTFYGIQEVKVASKHSPYSIIERQLVQAMHYIYLYDIGEISGYKHNFEVLVLNSEEYFGYIFLEDIQELKQYLWEQFAKNECTPSTSFKNTSLANEVARYRLDFNKQVVNYDYELHKSLRAIFKRGVKITRDKNINVTLH